MAQHPNLKNACLSGFAFWLQGSLRNCPAYLARPKDTQILVVSSHHLAPSLRKLDNHAYTSTKPVCGLTNLLPATSLRYKKPTSCSVVVGHAFLQNRHGILVHAPGSRCWPLVGLRGNRQRDIPKKVCVHSANVGAVFMYRVTIKISLAGPRKTTSGGGGGLLKPHQHYPFLGEGNHGSTPLRRMS